MAAKLSMDHLKLSAWAEEFERNQGKIRCEQRVENNERRRKGDFVRDFNSQNAAEFHRWRQERTARQFDKRAMETAVLDARHERERDQLKLDRDRKLEELRKRQKELTRADWRDLYTIQRQEEGRLTKARGNAWTRLRFFAQTHKKGFSAADRASRKQMLKGAFAALIGSRKQFDELEQKQRAHRIQYARALKAKTQDMRWRINEDYDKRLAQLKERQNDERQAQQLKHSAKSQDEAREIKQGRDREIYRKDKQRKRESELKDNKRDIVEKEQKPRRPSLRDKFAEARGKTRDKRRTKPNAPLRRRKKGEIAVLNLKNWPEKLRPKD